MNGYMLKDMLKKNPEVDIHVKGIWTVEGLCHIDFDNIEKNSAYIVNTARCGESYGHWLVIVISQDGKAELFDSASHNDPCVYGPYLKWFVKQHRPVWNATKIQDDEDSDLCGMFCLAYLNYKLVYNMSSQDICNLFSRDLKLNDDIVLKMVKQYYAA
jgi:hypothetical protein